MNKIRKQAPTQRVTAQDVADLAGVSPSTVSRVLSGKASGFISEPTRRRVREAADRLGYRPNPIARALRGKNSHLIGLVVREIADPFFAQVIAELSTQARKRDYQIVLGHAQNDSDDALNFKDLLDIRHTDGVIVLGNLRDDETALEELFQNCHAVVALNRAPAWHYTVGIDNIVGINTLLDHLYGLGHRQIAFIDGGWQGDIRERREAYLAYMQQKALPVSPEWIQAETNTPGGGYRAMQRLLELENFPAAVLASDDMVAVGALKAAADAGLHVPAQLSIVGFDDIDLARFLTPALTTMRQPIAEISRQALDLLLELVNERASVAPEVLLRIKPALIVRDSSGPPPD